MKLRAEDRTYHIIYKTTCRVTDKWYIGMHSTDNLEDGYLGSGQRLWKSIKKYGKETHSMQILEILPSRKEMIKREGEIITEELLTNPMCMNLRPGGIPSPGELKLTDESRAKISAVAKAMWVRRKADPAALAEHLAKLNKPEHIIKRSEVIKSKGHKRTPEQLARLSAGQIKYYADVDKSVLKERGRKVAEGKAKTWIIEDINGNRQQVKDLMKFSKANGIKGTSLYKTQKFGTYRNGYRIIGN